MDIKVLVNNQEIEVVKGTSLAQIAKDYQDNFKHDIILAKIDGIYKELTETVQKTCTIEFFDLTDRGANAVYINGLVYLTIYTYKRMFGFDKNIIIRHSLDKGLYIETIDKINEIDILKLEEEMKKVVEENLPIQRLTVSRLEAIDYFNKINYKTKSNLMNYNTSTFVTLYKLGNLYDYFYSLMPINTSYLSDFGLTYFNENEFVLRFPTIYISDEVKEFETRDNIFNLYQESRAWAKKQKLLNIVDLNKKVEESKIEEIIAIEEIRKNDKLMELARKIISNENVKIVLLAGPSSTGKTTTTNKLTLCLKSLGKNPKMLSMDDFFVERGETPLDEDGKPDFERLEAIDLKLFEDCIQKLLNKKN